MAPLIVKADLKHPTKVIQGVKVILLFFENMGVHGIDWHNWEYVARSERVPITLIYGVND